MASLAISRASLKLSPSVTKPGSLGTVTALRQDSILDGFGWDYTSEVKNWRFKGILGLFGRVPLTHFARSKSRQRRDEGGSRSGVLKFFGNKFQKIM